MENYINEEPHLRHQPEPEYSSRTPSPSPFINQNSVPNTLVGSELSHSLALNAIVSEGLPASAAYTFGAAGTTHPAALMSPDSPFTSPSPDLHIQKNAGKAPTSVRVQPRLHRLISLIHLVSVWCLLAYFVSWREPAVYEEHSVLFLGKPASWSRWIDLSWRNQTSSRGVQTVVSAFSGFSNSLST
jgi:GET complex subunit GET2